MQMTETQSAWIALITIDLMISTTSIIVVIPKYRGLINEPTKAGANLVKYDKEKVELSMSCASVDSILKTFWMKNKYTITIRPYATIEKNSFLWYIVLSLIIRYV